MTLTDIAPALKIIMTSARIHGQRSTLEATTAIWDYSESNQEIILRCPPCSGADSFCMGRCKHFVAAAKIRGIRLAEKFGGAIMEAGRKRNP